jgi:hypothetical protein
VPYLNNLLHKELLTDKTEARQLACRAKSFIIIEEELYKWMLVFYRLSTEGYTEGGKFS